MTKREQLARKHPGCCVACKWWQEGLNDRRNRVAYWQGKCPFCAYLVRMGTDSCVDDFRPLFPEAADDTPAR